MASNYGWIIDTETATTPGDGLPSRVGWTGPSNIAPAVQEQLRGGEGRKFRMFECDETCPTYTGRYVGPDGEEQFGPLDDVGTPDAGCTVIQYFENGRWETL